MSYSPVGEAAEAVQARCSHLKHFFPQTWAKSSARAGKKKVFRVGKELPPPWHTATAPVRCRSRPFFLSHLCASFFILSLLSHHVFVPRTIPLYVFSFLSLFVGVVACFFLFIFFASTLHLFCFFFYIYLFCSLAFVSICVYRTDNICDKRRLLAKSMFTRTRCQARTYQVDTLDDWTSVFFCVFVRIRCCNIAWGARIWFTYVATTGRDMIWRTK